MFSAIFCVLFGLSLLPGRKPLCLRFAERISGGIMPQGAEGYCRRLTWIWFFALMALAAAQSFDWRAGFASPLAVAAIFAIEARVRRRRFSRVFRTSGSTGAAKTVEKPFETLAREVAMHAAHYAPLIDAATGSDRSRMQFIATIEPGHMYGTLWREMLPAALGCPVDAEVVRSPEALVAKMRAAAHVFLVTTPSFLERFTAYAGQYDIPGNIFEIISSGALLSAAVAARAREVFGIAPREIFGSTETGGVAWRRQEEGGERWRVFAAVRVSCGRGAREGRLVVRSPYSFKRNYTMGDTVRLDAGARSFTLLARADRCVKINEVLVDLAEMEDRVRALGFADCALAVLEGARGPMLGAAIVCGDGRERPAPLEIRKALAKLFPKGTVPKRVRFLRALPRNAQGKVVAERIRAILSSSLVEPALHDASVSRGRFAAHMRFDGTEPYFSGHFPGFPLLPGVAQLGLAVRWSEALAGTPQTLARAKKIKFTTPIRPGDDVGIALEMRGEREIAYEFTANGAPASSGILEFLPSAPQPQTRSEP